MDFSRKTTYLYCSILMLVAAVNHIFWGWHSAWKWSAPQDFPCIMRIINPDFLLNDFYTSSTVHTPRGFFQKIIALPLLLFKFDFHRVMYGWKIFLILIQKPLFFLASISILSRWFPDKKENFHESMKLILLIFIAVDLPTLFGYHIAWGSISDYKFLAPMTFSFCSGMLYLYYANKLPQNNLLGIMTLVLTTFLHPTVGVCFYLFNQIMNIPLNDLGQRKNLFLEGFVGLFLPLLIIRLSYPFIQTALPINEFIYYYVRIRHPHHYLMSYALNVNIQFILFTIIFFILFVITIFSKQKKIILLSSLCLLSHVLTAGIQYFGTEVFPSRFITLVGPSRFFCFIPALLTLELLIIIGLIMKKHPPLLKKITFAIIALLKRFNFSKIISFLPILTFITLWTLLSINTYTHPLELPKHKNSLGTLKWISNNTNPTDTIHVEYQIFDTGLIRMFSERAATADHATVYNENFLKEYLLRFEMYKNSLAYSSEEYKEISRKFPMDYIVILPSRREKFKNYTPVYEDEYYLIYKTEDL